MRILFIILFSTFLTRSFAQVEFDTSVRQDYEKAYNKLPKDLQERLPTLHADIAVVTLHVIDTLNKDQLKPGVPPDRHEVYPILMGGAVLNHDSIGISLIPGVMKGAGVEILQLVTHDSSLAEYAQWDRYDTSFRKNLEDKKGMQINLEFTTRKLILDNPRFTLGETIYGYADILSEPFFHDDEQFRSGYIQQRIHLQYYFKFKLDAPGR